MGNQYKDSKKTKLVQTKILKSYNPGHRLDFPTKLQFEPIQLCNAACFCCPYSWLKDDKEYLGKRMPRDKIINLIQQFGQPILDNNYQGAYLNPFRYSDPLVCKDLELIFEECVKYNIKVQITTNAVSLTPVNIDLLERYVEHIYMLNISIIGTTQEDVKKYMEVNLNKTLEKLQKLSDRDSILLKYLKVGIKTVTGTEEEIKKAKQLRGRIKTMGIPGVKIKRSWETNRLGGHKQWEDRAADSNKHVIGCMLSSGSSISKNIHVMVDGDVVLCCDDATKEKVYGNVFKDNLLDIWNGALKKEEELLWNKNKTTEKDKLICNNCSRAIFSK